MNWGHLGIHVAEVLLPLAAAAATGLLAKGAQYALHAVAGIKNTQVRDALDWAITQAQTVADQVVVALNQTVVGPAKAAGTWDATVAAQTKKDAESAVMATLGTNAQEILRTNLPGLPQWLSDVIEAAVATAPNKTQAPSASHEVSPAGSS